MGQLDVVLRALWEFLKTPAARIVMRETAKYVDNEVIPAAQRGIDRYRLAVAAKEAAERNRHVNELRGQIAVYTVDECLQFLDCLKEEPDNNVRAQLIELVADRLKALKGGA